MKISLNRYIGPEGAAFTRVGLAFQAYDYYPPHDDSGDPQPPHGAYVSSIVSQYQGSLTQNEVLALIEYGLTNPVHVLEREVTYHEERMYTLEDLTSIYVDKYVISQP